MMSDIPVDTISWPPSYVIKKHRLARHVKLRTKKPHGLEITVPVRFNLKEIPDILEQHKSWIEHHLRLFHQSNTFELPDAISLPALGETWKVHYLASNKKIEMIMRPSNEIVLVGKVEDRMNCQRLLKKWIKLKSKQFLTQRLYYLSQLTQLNYTNLSIKDQQTLWGSCTVSGAINLNYKLVFLPPALADHVMIHELCHTRHLNHSKRFWQLVASFDPYCDENKKDLKTGDRYIPAWAGIDISG